MLRVRLPLLAGLTLTALGCGPGLRDGANRGEGVDSFASASFGRGGNSERSATDAATPPGADAGLGGTGNGAPRTVEEGDVYKVVGDTLYVLNMYRGLQIIDVSNPDQPVKRGTSRVLGAPVEMYVRDGFAYLVVSDYFTWQQTPDGAAKPFHGSQVRVVDVRNPDAPVVVGGLDLEGAVSDTRIVGDVLYVVANRWAWYDNAASSDTSGSLVVTSIDLAAPSAPIVRETMSFPGASHVIHASPTTLYVASNEWSEAGGRTKVELVDIDDPAGDLEAKGSLVADGTVDQRFQLDEYAGHFRLVTHSGSWGQDGSQLLSVFRLAPDVGLVSTLKLPNTGGLFATRFDGERGYLVTMVSVDPLEVLDLRDPANPVLTHSLVIPGVIQQLVPRGDRLLALGTDGSDGVWSGVAASLFDVSDPQAPVMLARAPVGEGSVWSSAQWDDKALKVLDAEGMMLVPFSAWSVATVDTPSHYANGFQVLSFDRRTLKAEGVVEQSGQVSRVFGHRRRLLSVSDRVLQSVDATDREKLKVTSTLELAREVTDLVVVGGRTVTLSNDGWWWSSAEGRCELRVGSPQAPEDVVIGRLELPFRAERLFADGDGVVVVGAPQWQWAGSPEWDGSLRLVRVSLADPAQPRLEGAPLVVGLTSSSGGWSHFGIAAAARVSDGVVVVPAWTTNADARGYWSTVAELVTVDVARGLFGRLALPGPMAGELVVDGGSLWASHSEELSVDGSAPLARYYADRVDLADAAAPLVAEKINIPGTLVGVAGDALFTRDYQWTADGRVTHALAECTRANGRAVLRRYLEVDEGLGRIIADGRRLYATTQPWSWSYGQPVNVSLRVFASSDQAPLAEVSRTPVGDWLQLRALAGGHLFLGSGYFGGPWDYGVYGGGMGARTGAVDGPVASDAAMPGYGYGGSAQGLVDYSLADPDRPAFRQYVRTSGWVQGLAADGARLFVSSGIYGVATVDLVP
ncbi:MAG: hypothetical protein RL199_367 [Pseudomonadota bacterium]|jgi:hypothetical protein